MRVLLVDNHWVSRLGLLQFFAALDPATEAVEASSLSEAVAHLGGHRRFDLCLLDFALDQRNPLAVLRELRARAADTRIVIFTGSGSRRLALEAAEEGASGFVLKSAARDDLARAIERVMAGDIWLPADLGGTPAGAGERLREETGEQTEPGASVMDALTPRQRQVLELIALGKRNADIAEALGISPRTVQIHVSTILKLLKVNNRTEAALLAHRPRPLRNRS